MTFERNFFLYLENMKRRILAQPLVLGGVSSSGGGIGGPAGGFIGQLPQSRVTFDKLEATVSGIPSSGASLLDNLNRIRYDIANLSGIGGNISIQEDDIEISSAVTVINFEGSSSVIDEGSGKVTIITSGSDGGSSDFLGLTDTPSDYTGHQGEVPTVNATEDGLEFTTVSGAGSDNFLGLIDTPSSYIGHAGKSAVVNSAEDALEFITVSGSGGGSNGFNYIQEDLTTQIPASGDDFNLNYTPASGTLILHYNGLTQQYNNYTILTSGVHTNFSPISGDELFAEYYYDTSGEGITNPTISVYSGSTLVKQNVSSLKFLGMEVTDSGGNQVTISGSTSSGGEVTEDYSYWSVDAPPASPSEYDDEFDDSSFDTGIWTDFDEPSSLTYSENEYGFTWTGHSTSNYIQGIYQDVPSGNGWSIMTKVSVIYKQHDDAKCGLMLLEDTTNLSTSDVIFNVMTVGGAGTGVQVEKFNSYNSYLGNVGSIFADKWLTTFYLRIRADGSNNWYFDWSSDGVGWINKDDWFANGVDAGRLWEPDGFGLCIRGNTTSPRFIIHWFRYSTDTAVNSVVYGDRISGFRN